MLKDFLQFCAKLQGWIHGGTKPHTVFVAQTGICHNWAKYCREYNLGTRAESANWLNQHFRDMQLDPIEPFMGLHDYYDERDAGTLWQNEKRKAFVDEHARLWRQVCSQLTSS